MTQSPQSKTLEAGTVLGPYVVERKLPGHGNFYLGHDDGKDQDATIELYRGEISAAGRTRVIRDARTLSGVEHPGLVRIYAAGEHDESPWVAMEIVRAVDLERHLEDRGAVPPGRALRWMSEAVLALAAAHDLGIVHRALEPANVLLTHDDVIKVKGFGMGSPRAEAYASPELLEHGLADERSDVWAMGCLLFELTSGVPPFGIGGTATLAAIERDEPIFPPNLPGSVTAVIAACLRKSSFARLSSMRELRSLLRDAQENPAGASGAPERTSERWRTSGRHFPTLPPAPAEIVNPRANPSSAPRMRSSVPPARHPTSSTALRVPSAKGNIKGSALRPAIAWFVDTYGEDSVARVFELASPELKSSLHVEDLAFGILPSGWYDALRAGEMLTLLERVADPDDSDAYNNGLAAAIAKDNVNGVYRALFRLVTTPKLLEANIQRVWRTYCDEGTLIARVPREGQLEFELTGWERHHPQACRVLGFSLQHMLRGVGYRGLVIERTRCVSSGDADCAFEANYLA